MTTRDTYNDDDLFDSPENIKLREAGLEDEVDEGPMTTMEEIFFDFVKNGVTK